MTLIDGLIAWLAGNLSWLRVEVWAPLGLVVAAAVTIHVLLTKRDVGSSIGWIGLAWLAPILGGVFYFLLGINRVKRRARRLTDDSAPTEDPPGLATMQGADGHLAPLERAGRRITRRPITAGNALDILHNGDEAYPPMIAAITAATTSVGLCSYILRDDAAGGQFIDALIEAHRRHVAVRVLVDGIGSGYFLSAAYYRLRAAGVPAARFMHSSLPWRMPFLNLRTHKKMLLIDGNLAFTGGMNIGAENVLASHPKAPVRDTHFRVRGPVVAQLAEAFARDWSFATNEELTGPAWFPELAPVPDGQAMARVVTSGPDLDLEKIEFLVLQAITCAHTSVRVITPYFLPDERLMTALTLAAMRGVAVDVIIPEHSNHRLIDWATRANIGPYLASGGRLWLNPPPFEHSKGMVVDGQWSLIGSANFDMRSFRLNFELSMEIYDTTLAQTIDAAIQSRQGRPLTETDLQARLVPQRLRDAAVRLGLPYL
jgi:cardiolipin synthase